MLFFMNVPNKNMEVTILTACYQINHMPLQPDSLSF